MKNLKKIWAFLGVGILLTVSLASIAPHKVIAATAAVTSADWVDIAHIKIGDDVYIDTITDGTLDFTLAGSQQKCASKIHGFIKGLFEQNVVAQFQGPADPLTGTCAKSVPIKLNTPANSQIMFNWIDAATLQSTYLKLGDLEGGTFNIINDPAYPDEYSQSTSDSCKSSIKAKAGSKLGTLTVRINASGCKTLGSALPVNIGSTDNAKKTAGTGVVNEPGANTGEALLGSEASCESIGGFAWIFCPALKLMDAGVNFLDNQVISLLQVPRGYYAGNDSLKATWERIRNIALILLVPIMLVMVISTALGFNFVDAYTIKKALPRAVAAVMFIVLSWWIMVFLLDITNELGTGILGLLTGAFGGVKNLNLSSLFEPGSGLLLSLGAGAAVAAGSTIFIILITSAVGIQVVLIVLSLAFVTFLGLFIAFLVLVLRQMILITLILFAPLAILSWIFPNNNKLWKLWWESFSKLLLMFPIIMVIIAAGKIFATVAATTSTGIAGVIITIFAYIMPYFFIPATFKIAGGLFATLSGTINNKSKGLFDRQRNFRKKRFDHAKKEGWEAMRAGKAFKNLPSEHKMNSRLQQLAHIGSIADKGLKGMFSEAEDGNGNKILDHHGNTIKGWQSNIRAAIEGTERAHVKHAMEDDLLNTWAMNDEGSGVGGAVLNHSAEDIRRRLMHLGVGMATEWQKGEDGKESHEAGANGKWVVDKAGGVVNEAVLAAKTKEISDLMDKGDREGAFRQGLISTGTFGIRTLNGDGTMTITEQDMGQIDAYTSHFMRDSRRLGDEVLANVLVKKASAGGTYYADAVHMWGAAKKAVGHNGSALGEMSASARGINTNAGRVDIGGASHGTSVNLMQKTEKTEKDAEEAKQVVLRGGGTQEDAEVAYRTVMDGENNKNQTKFSEHIIDNTPASILLNQIMKEGFNDDNLLSVYANRIQAAATASKDKGTDSPEYDEYMRLVGEASSAHQALLQSSKPALAKRFGNTVMDRELDDEIKTYGRKVKMHADTGEPVKDPTSGELVYETVETGTTKATVRSATEKYKSDPVLNKYHFTYGGTDEYDGARRAGGAPGPGGGLPAGMPQAPGGGKLP